VISRVSFALLAICASSFAACGGKPVEPGEPTTTAEPPPVTQAESPAPAPETSAEPAASAAPAAEPASTGRAPSGRPPLFFPNPTKIAEQVGETPSAKFELGGPEGAYLKVPEYAIRTAILLTFMIDKKAKRHKGAVGETYRLQAQIPPSADFSTVESGGPAFELKLPKTGPAANLAIGETKTDGAGKEATTWKVVAPKKVDDAAKAAIFEISGFTNATLHLTTEAPGG
jgi:hypothetical protein